MTEIHKVATDEVLLTNVSLQTIETACHFAQEKKINSKFPSIVFSCVLPTMIKRSNLTQSFLVRAIKADFSPFYLCLPSGRNKHRDSWI